MLLKNLPASLVLAPMLLVSGCSRADSLTPPVAQPAPVVATPASTTAPVVRKLVWQDEFDKPGLPDTTKWAYDVGGNGWGNNELQYYTARRPENARVEGGNLIIEARREPWQGSQYTSARLLTQGKTTWQYGRFEARAKLPAGLGTWPAVWMLGKNIVSAGWPRCGELDIMEHVGYDEGVVHGSIHSEQYNHVKNTQKTATVTLTDATTAFHVYAIDWTPDKIEFIVDDRAYFTVYKSALGSSEAAWPFDQPFFLILNLAVGGNWGGAKGVDTTIWPRRMEVDYVRIYQ